MPPWSPSVHNHVYYADGASHHRSNSHKSPVYLSEPVRQSGSYQRTYQRGEAEQAARERREPAPIAALRKESEQRGNETQGGTISTPDGVHGGRFEHTSAAAPSSLKYISAPTRTGYRWRQGRCLIQSPRGRSPILFTQILWFRTLANAISRNAGVWSFKFRSDAHFVNVQHGSRATPPWHIFSCGKLTNRTGPPTATSGQSDGLFRASTRRSLLFAVSFRVAFCAIARCFHCWSNYPEIDASWANSRSLSASSHM